MNGNGAERPVYLKEPCAIPFCRGCGHSHVVRQLDEALKKLQLDPSQVCLVTDIGCIGLIDSLFSSVHTVHTTHGRSTAFATGIELADSVLGDSRLKTIVLIGDGGAMIGLLHLVNAALMNGDITVLLCNNFLFGMTGGQNSAFSPLEFITATSPRGNVIPPLDICNVVADAHAPFVVRKLATDKDLSATIADAIAFEGFALVEIVELCTEYATKRNHLSGNKLRQIVEANGQTIGVITKSAQRCEFGSLYVDKFPCSTGREAEDTISPNSILDDEFLQQLYAHRLEKRIGLVVAGSAGERVQSTASLFCKAAVRSGLFCTQKNDNPVTQGTGFSLSEICLSPHPILYTGIDDPDVIVVVSEDGLSAASARGYFRHLSSSVLILADSGIHLPATAAKILQLPLRSTCGPAKAAAAALLTYLEIAGIFPARGFIDALEAMGSTPYFPEPFFSVMEEVTSARMKG